ncbi:hypothetical protein FRC11_007758 [Ceratobasidium sp. 423]|nr:hypothetical protein FRC11_007758 [Ceratobasidium sp. 423]
MKAKAHAWIKSHYMECRRHRVEVQRLVMIRMAPGYVAKAGETKLKEVSEGESKLESSEDEDAKMMVEGGLMPKGVKKPKTESPPPDAEMESKDSSSEEEVEDGNEEEVPESSDIEIVVKKNKKTNGKQDDEGDNRMFDGSQHKKAAKQHAQKEVKNKDKKMDWVVEDNMTLDNPKEWPEVNLLAIFAAGEMIELDNASKRKLLIRMVPYGYGEVLELHINSMIQELQAKVND